MVRKYICSTTDKDPKDHISYFTAGRAFHHKINNALYRIFFVEIYAVPKEMEFRSKKLCDIQFFKADKKDFNLVIREGSSVFTGTYS